MGTLWQDVKYSARMLVKNRGVTAVAVLTLALGIGANTVVFSLVNGVMLRPLPFSQPERLVRIWESSPQRGWPTFAVSQPNFLDFQEQNQSLKQMAATTGRSFNLTGVAEPERIQGLAVSASFFSVLGVQPTKGRTFSAEEDSSAGNNRVVVMSDGLWKRRFGSDPAIVGKEISLNEQSFTVIGVLPPEFRWGENELFAPLVANRNQSRGDHRLSVIGRLKPGFTLQQALTDLTAIAKRLEQQYPDSNGGWTVTARSFYDWLIPEETRRALGVMLGAVAFVLLIACVNVANLQLARASARRKEIAIRAALGGGGLRLARQMLTESVLLACFGGMLGIILAAWGLDLLRTGNPGNLPRMQDVELDRNVLLFTLAISVVAGILFGLAPALRSARTDMNETLKEGGRNLAGEARQGTRSALIVVEVALSLVLLVGAGLLVRSFWELLQVQPGYDSRNLLTANLTLPSRKYPARNDYVAFYQRLQESLRALPGVKAAAVASGVPMGGSATAMEVYIDGRQPGPGGQRPSAEWRLVSPGYFQAMRIPLLKGRDLNESDYDSKSEAANFRGVVVSEEMARRNWPGEDAVGKQFRPWAERNQPVSIVGVVGNVRNFGLESEPEPVVYINYEARTWNPITVVMRTELDPNGYAGALRKAVRDADPNLPVASVATMDELLERTMTSRRFNLYLLGVFSGVALVLAAVGLFGVLAYLVSQRTHEIGVRMALGARPKDILHMVVRRGLLLALAGVAAGVCGALALTHLMSSMLFQVKPRDPLTIAVTAAMLMIVSLAACYVPARRATKVDPMVALRYE